MPRNVRFETLRARLDREGQLPINEALGIASELARALHDLHERGSVHGAIQPESILLSEGGAAAFDVGAAGAIDRAVEEQPTETGQTVGAAAYVSPEQASGRERANGQSDQYALGCVLYEMLAGHPPFQGSSAATVLARHIRDAVPPVSSVRPTVTPGIESVIGRALSKAPADRFPTSARLALALDAAARDAATMAVVLAPLPALRGAERRSARASPDAAGGYTRRLRRRALATALIVAAAGVGYAVLARGGGGDLDVEPLPSDADPLARSVLPFGAPAELSDLGIAVVDLLLPWVNPDDVGPDAPGTLVAWREQGGGDASSASVMTARRTAIALGTPTLVVGTLTGTPASYTMTAELLGVEEGRVIARGAVRGSASEAPRLVIELAAQLLGKATDEMLMAVSRPALEAYVHGLRKSRRDGEAAVRHFTTALELEPTFGSAAYARLYELRHMARGMTRTGAVAHETWALRHRMSERERAYLTIDFGPGGPGTDFPFAGMLRLAEETAHAHPDWWEMWHAYGYLLGLDGGNWGDARWAERVVNAMDAALALAPPRSLESRDMKQIRFWVARHVRDLDPSRLRAYGTAWIETLEETDSQGAFARWLVGHALADSGLVEGARASPAFRSLGFDPLIEASAFEGLPLADAEEAVSHRAAGAGTAQEGFFVENARARIAILRGNGAAAAEAWRRMDELDISDWFVRTQLATVALFEPAWRPLAGEAIEHFYQPRDTVPGQLEWPHNFDRPWNRLCVRELWGFLVRGERGRPYLRSAGLADLMWEDSIPAFSRYTRRGDRGFCNAALEALEETASDPTGPAPALARLDTLMMNRPFGGWFPAVGNLILAHLHEVRDDPHAALRALRRPKSRNGGVHLTPTYLREEGRLAEATGDRDGAIRAYRHYLLLRTDTDDVARTEVGEVCAKLTSLAPGAVGPYRACRTPGHLTGGSGGPGD